MKASGRNIFTHCQHKRNHQDSPALIVVDVSVIVVVVVEVVESVVVDGAACVHKTVKKRLDRIRLTRTKRIKLRIGSHKSKSKQIPA